MEDGSEEAEADQVKSQHEAETKEDESSLGRRLGKRLLWLKLKLEKFKAQHSPIWSPSARARDAARNFCMIMDLGRQLGQIFRERFGPKPQAPQAPGAK